MIGTLNQAISEYRTSWQALVAQRKDKAFFEGLHPTAIGWKVADLATFDHQLALLRKRALFIHMTWLNGRWLADVGLREPLANGIRVVKLMQRRPGSTDAVGLDHIDFYSPGFNKVKDALSTEAGIKWTEEQNGEHCKWISIWFAGHEAKLRPDLALDASIGDIEDFKKVVMRDVS